MSTQHERLAMTNYRDPNVASNPTDRSPAQPLGYAGDLSGFPVAPTTGDPQIGMSTMGTPTGATPDPGQSLMAPTTQPEGENLLSSTIDGGHAYDAKFGQSPYVSVPSMTSQGQPDDTVQSIPLMRPRFRAYPVERTGQSTEEPTVEHGGYSTYGQPQPYTDSDVRKTGQV